MFSSAALLRGHILTTEPRNRPVASDAGGKARQLEDKGSGIGVCVVVSGSDVNAVDISAHPFTDLRLLRYESWGVVINIYQIDLQCACAAGCRRAWERREGRENSIMMGGKDDKMCAVKGMIKKKGQVLKGGKKSERE